MSLLEEEPELNMFENDIKYKKNTIYIGENEIKIHDNFRLLYQHLMKIKYLVH